YSTSHYDANGSVVSVGPQGFGSPTASAGNNPDLIPKKLDRPGSGEYSRAGCDSLYPSGLWETANLNTNLILEQANDMYLKRTTNNNTLSGYHNYSDKMPIIDSSTSSATTMNLDDETSSVDFMSRTFPRSSINAHGNNQNQNQSSGGYPSDYGLPIVPGVGMGMNGIPMNAKTLRVWQKGGVPVLPPVTALKRALTNSRNSPDEGYQEGCGTDV
ncbi:unnamed protein product, partial [Diamesa tonsa]